MLYDTRRFVFTVSLCAMLAVNPVLATAPGEEELVSTVHDVYTESTNTGTEGAPLNLSSGIAGVTYVNRMVNSAGNAAQRAEDHAAAAGASAIAAQSAADAAQDAADAAQGSADAATETLKSKLDIFQGTENKNKVMTTDASGNVVTTDVLSSDVLPLTTMENQQAGAVKMASFGDFEALLSGEIAEEAAMGSVPNVAFMGAYVEEKGMQQEEQLKEFMQAEFVPRPGIGVKGDKVLFRTDRGMNWGEVSATMIANRAVLERHIADGAITVDKIDASSGSYTPGGVLIYSGSGMYWDQVHSGMIASGAVTMDKIDADIRSHSYSGVLGFYSGYGVSGMYWDQVRSDMIADGAVTMSKISENGEYGVSTGVLVFYSGSNPGQSGMYWDQVRSDMIADGAVTPDKTVGVVGTIPWGSADSTTYGQFWIE